MLGFTLFVSDILGREVHTIFIEQSIFTFSWEIVSHLILQRCHSLLLCFIMGPLSLLQGYYFHTENPFKDWPGAFEEGLKKMKEGDLPVTILYLEAAILQEPNDAEVFTHVPFIDKGKGDSL